METDHKLTYLLHHAGYYVKSW